MEVKVTESKLAVTPSPSVETHEASYTASRWPRAGAVNINRSSNDNRK
jgi:hypothetical protein